MPFYQEKLTKPILKINKPKRLPKDRRSSSLAKKAASKVDADLQAGLDDAGTYLNGMDYRGSLNTIKKEIQTENAKRIAEQAAAHENFIFNNAIDFIEKFGGVERNLNNQIVFWPPLPGKEVYWAEINNMMKQPGLLNYAATHSRVKALHFLLNYSAPQVINQKLPEPAISQAVRSGSVDAVDVFLQYVNKVDINLANSKRKTPVHLAINMQRPDIVARLVQRGANFSVKDGMAVNLLPPGSPVAPQPLEAQKPIVWSYSTSPISLGRAVSATMRNSQNDAAMQVDKHPASREIKSNIQGKKVKF